MTREEYIEELRARISHLPKEERESALSYYIEYLEDATDKTMEEIVAELGTPGEVAERIIAECAQSNQERGENAGCLVGALAVLTSPVWLPGFIRDLCGGRGAAVCGHAAHLYLWRRRHRPAGRRPLGCDRLCRPPASRCWAGR